MDTVAISRKVTDDKGKETTVKGSFTIEWPKTPEAYSARFENDSVRDAFQYQALKQRLKQAAGSFLTGNPKDGARRIQEYMNAYTVKARATAKAHTASRAVLKELDIDTDKLAALAAHLGISVEIVGDAAEAVAGS